MRALPIALAVFVLSSFAAAQDPDPAEARTRAARTVDCLERVQHDLATTMRLLRDAIRQTESDNARARNDAAQTVVTLQQRVVRLSTQLKACAPTEAELRPRTVVTEPTGTDAAVERANDIPSVERGVDLSRNVHAVIGHRVDGTGTVPHANIKSGIRGISDRLERCYARLVDREALTTGQLNLAFTIDPGGRVRDVVVESSTISNTRFTRCVRSAGRRIRPGTISRGGDARYSYTLRFGTPPRR